MTLTETAYDRVAYPSAIFERTHPERMAVIGQLHGLTPPDIGTARVLEIGCGDGMNLIAFAAAYPNASFVGFDLASTPIERGQAVAAAAGLGNVTLMVMDARDAVAAIPAGSFDYIIAHGVYAWVPDAVRVAIMRLLGHALSPDGMVFLSYNSLPGGYLRMAMRDMLRLEVGGIADPDAKIAATVAFLEGMKSMETRGDPSIEAIRAQAESMLQRSPALLFHDELGECYAPQSLMDVAAAASEAGLRFLSDAGRNRHFDGFLDAAQDLPDDHELAVLRGAQMDDYLSMRYFRQSILVRGSVVPSRLVDTDRLDGLWASTKLVHDPETGLFALGEVTIEMEDAEFAGALLKIVESGIARIAVTGLVNDPQRRAILLRLFNEWSVQLHTGPAPFAAEVGPYPLSSPLVRVEIARGDMRLCTLDHRIIEIEQAGLRALLGAANGERTIDEIAGMVDIEFEKERIPAAFAACAQRALMVR